METRKYEAVIFDLGNTIFYIDFNKAFEYWAKASNQSLEAIQEKFVFDDEHKLFESGKLSEEGYVEHLNKVFGSSLSYEDFYNGWNDIYLENLPHIEKAIAAIKGNYQLAALSNTNLTHEKYWSVHYKEVLEPFDQIFASHHLGSVKPKLDIYQKAAAKLNVDPAQCIFLDDKKENIEGAENAGMTGVWVQTPQQMYKDLAHLNILNENFWD